MSLSATQLIASAEVCGEALWLFRVARDLTQADIKEFSRRAPASRDRCPLRLDIGETMAKQREPEERYFTPIMLEKYQRSLGALRTSS